MKQAAFLKQQGAALITAMLLAALITILAASWLARFDSQLRIAEVARSGTQARWLMRAATDWARMILTEDDASYDDLTEVWSIPIAPIRMTDIAGAQEAFFSGRLQDAQARFNLYNIYSHYTTYLAQAPSTGMAIDPALAARLATEQAWCKALMQASGLTPEQAQAWIVALHTRPATDTAPNAVYVLDTLPAKLSKLPSPIKATLESRFIWLPELTHININTVDAVVLAAHPQIGASLAQKMIQTRQQAPIRDANNIANALLLNTELAQEFGINTHYFLATGRLTMGRIDMMAQSLLQRSTARTAPTLLWTHTL